MGCVSSKQAKKQALLEEKWGKTSPTKRKPYDQASHNELSFEEYHRHLVALTSSSYGLLKMDTPKPSEEVKRSTARVRSLDDLYDRFDTSESMEPTPNSWHETGSVLCTVKPGLQRSISIPIHQSNKPTVQETINVSDIMQGLEEGASSSSSPSKNVGSMTPFLNKLRSPPREPENLSLRHKKYDKLPTFHNTSEGVGKPLFNAGGVVNEKLNSLPIENSSGVSANTVVHLEERYTKPSHAERDPTIIQTRRDRANQDQLALSMTELVPNESKYSDMENRSQRKNHQPNLSSKLPAGVSYATSSRRLKLTLNLEYENTLLTGMLMSQDACNSADSSARRSIVDALTEPDSPLFDPALLASYEKALKELRKEDWNIADDANDLFEKMCLTKETQMDVEMAPTLENSSDGGEMAINSVDPLNEFEWRCPPDGEQIVVLYTTSLRGIRKTFEDCNNVRDILKGFNVGFHERDVSMHSAYRNELKELLVGQVAVPSLFIKGRYIGGVDDVRKLHEESKVAAFLNGIPKDANNGMCDGCGDMRFVPCLACCGSCKVVDQDNSVSRCSECNENGLIPCPICS